MVQKSIIFLTGFPGFIATRLVSCLANDETRFLLLVQSKFKAPAEAAINRIADETRTPLANFEIFDGDITHFDLGLSNDDSERIRRETTHIAHLAAVYDLGVAKDLAMRVNLEGTRNINRFARQVKNLHRYDYVSTCYVAGNREGLIYENELVHAAGFRNFYEQTKYLAELEVENLKPELPVCIHRPSVVCGDSVTGETAKYDGIYYLIHYLRMRPELLSFVNIGNQRVRLNLVPVDFVVNSIATLMRDDASINCTLQLADPAPLTTRELFDCIARALSGHSSFIQLPPTLVQTSLKLPLSEVLTKMPRVAVPYFFLEQTYDIAHARRLLQPHGIACPSFDSYVANLINYVAAHPKL